MKRAVLGLLLVTGAGGCGDDDSGGGVRRDGGVVDTSRDANAGLLEVALVPNNTNRELDVLFVIDDSPSMLDKQTNLKNSFGSFITTLAAGGLPSVHIGVVTTDMGAKGEDDAAAGADFGQPGSGGCVAIGKDGALQTFNSTMITGSFLSDENGSKNFAGALTDRFNEIASAGTGGCGFEQPFHAIRRALDPAKNAGFLRANARLAIIVLSDEDDCSIAHSTIMGSDTATFGPLQSFRCTRFGVLCDVGGTTSDTMNQIGTKDGCHSNDGSPYMTDVGRYATFLKGLKSDPREVFFGALVGNTAPFEVELRTPAGGGTALPALAHSCTYTGGIGQEVADPAVRIAELAALLPRGTVASVCNANLAAPMTDLAVRMKPLIGDGCLQQAIQQPAVCEAFDIDGTGGSTPLAACDASNTPPCFSLEADATLCPSGTQHLKVNIVRTTGVSADTWTSVRCAL